MTGLLAMFWYAVTSSLEQLGQGELLIQSMGKLPKFPWFLLMKFTSAWDPPPFVYIISVLLGAVRTVHREYEVLKMRYTESIIVFSFDSVSDPVPCPVMHLTVTPLLLISGGQVSSYRSVYIKCVCVSKVQSVIVQWTHWDLILKTYIFRASTVSQSHHHSNQWQQSRHTMPEQGGYEASLLEQGFRFNPGSQISIRDRTRMARMYIATPII